MEYVSRLYRNNMGKGRFYSFTIQYKETDLWIGISPEDYKPKIKDFAYKQVKELRDKMDAYLEEDKEYASALLPYMPAHQAPGIFYDMSAVAQKTGIGPMSAVAGAFAEFVGQSIICNFDVDEIVVENGGDVFIDVKRNITINVFAGESPISEKIGIDVPANYSPCGICTSAGKVGPSLSFGQAHAVMVACKDIKLADSWATAIGNKIKCADDINDIVNEYTGMPEIKSLIIVCDDKLGIGGELELKIITNASS